MKGYSWLCVYSSYQTDQVPLNENATMVETLSGLASCYVNRQGPVSMPVLHQTLHDSEELGAWEAWEMLTAWLTSSTRVKGMTV